jgi:hypothetical protein
VKIQSESSFSSSSSKQLDLLDSSSSTPGGSDLDDEEFLNYSLQHVSEIDRATFIEMYPEYLDHKMHFSKLRTVLYVELGVRPETGKIEREVIKSILDGDLNFQNYIVKHM